MNKWMIVNIFGVGDVESRGFLRGGDGFEGGRFLSIMKGFFFVFWWEYC